MFPQFGIPIKQSSATPPSNRPHSSPNMKQLLLICAAVALMGCGTTQTDPFADWPNPEDAAPVPMPQHRLYYNSGHIGLGIVRGTKVSARGKPTIFSALVFQFNENEPLNILEEITIANPKADEPRRWYRVQVPSDCGLWVHSDFLNPATTIDGVNAQGKPVKLNVAAIKANLLNVRGGAGEEFPILSKLPRGAQVVLTGASKAKWREVLAPQNASVYVAAQFVIPLKLRSWANYRSSEPLPRESP